MQRLHGCRAVAVLLLAGTLAAAQIGESVLVPAKDYQKLLDDLEAAKKAKAAKPLPPSVCHVECELKRTKERPLAALTLTYQFRTTTPRTMVMLGGQRAFAVKASLDGGGTPALEATADGIVATIDTPGEHTLTLHLEAAIGPRGVKGDVGFDVGLPRAAITRLTLSPMELKAIALGTRWAEGGKPGEVKTLTLDPAKFKSYPLGPTDVLELEWEVPKAVPPVTEPTLDADITVRVADAFIETVATLKLRGPAKEWTFTLPAGADLTGNATIVKPADAKKREWKATLISTEATLIATVRQPRGDLKAFSVGPFFAMGSVRQSGTVKLFAPPTLRLIPKPAAEVRRAEAAAGDDSPVAVFRYAFNLGPERKPVPLADVELRTASGFVVVQPQHKLTLTSLGWKLRSEFRIAPIRVGVEQVAIELPAGWQAPQFSPLDLVEEVILGGDATALRTLQVRLVAPQREPFALVLESIWPIAAESREASLPLPRTLARERDSEVSVLVPESLEVSGSVREGDAKALGTASDLKRIKPNVLAGSFDGPVSLVTLAWQAFRAKVAAESRVEVTLSERQMTIAQSIALSFPDGAKSVRLSGPATAAGFRASPGLDALGPGEWSYTPPTGAKDATLTLNYAVPVKLVDGSTRVAVPLVWADAMTATTTVRVWSTNTFRRPVGFEGAWREAQPEASPERDSLPALSLTSTTVNVPLSLDVADCDPTGSVVVDRAVDQWWIAEGGSVQGRSRFLLRRWPATLEIDLAGMMGLTVFVDHARVEPAAIRGDTVRIALPDAKPSRPALLLELRYTGPASAAWSGVRLAPPTLRGAVYRTPTWWQITLPDGSVPLTLDGHLTPEISWRWTTTGFTPAAGLSSDDLDRWLSDGTADAIPGDHALTARQGLPAPVTLLQIPRLIALAVVAVLVLGCGLALARLRNSRRVVALGVIAVLLALGAIFWPQPVSQLASLAQPGLALLAIVLLGQKLLRSWQSNRSTATFSRGTAMVVASSPTIELPARRSNSGAVSQAATS